MNTLPTPGAPIAANSEPMEIELPNWPLVLARWGGGTRICEFWIEEFHLGGAKQFGSNGSNGKA